MTLLLWIGVVIVVIAAIAKKWKDNVIIFHNNRNTKDFNNLKNPFQTIFSDQFFNRGTTSHHQWQSPNTQSEQMVCCEQCGVFVPISKSYRRAGRLFCSQEHAMAWFSSDHNHQS